jgi:hypothetical protein
MKLYKIRKFKSGNRQDGKAFWNYALTVPANVAEHLSNDLKFACELTDEGILYKPVRDEEVELPDWAQ